MDIPNAFVGKETQPTAKEIANALGPTAQVWQELISHLSERLGVADQEWKSYSPKYGWSLLLKLKKRTIVYLALLQGCFQASFVLGGRAVAAARTAGLPKGVLRALDEAPRYAEGTGLRLIVKTAQDLAKIEKLAQIKLAN